MAKQQKEVSTEVALTERLSVVLPAITDDLLADAETMAPEFERDDLALPFLRILQDLSPEVKKSKPEFVEGAEPGDFLHSITRRVWKGSTGLTVVPVSYERRHIEWKLRTEGGGFVKDWGYVPDLLATCSRNEKNQDILPNGNQLVATAVYYLLILTQDAEGGVVAVEEAVLPLKATQLKRARQWNALISSRKIQHPKTGQYLTPPMFYGTYLLTTVEESNDQGTWASLKVEPVGTVETMGAQGVQIYQMAKHIAAMVKRGERKADLKSEMSAEARSSEEDEVRSGGNYGDTLPLPF